MSQPAQSQSPLPDHSKALSSPKKRWQHVRRWLQRSLLFLLSLWLVLSLWQAPIVPVGNATTQELRGIWMTNIGAALMYYTTRLDEAVANMAHHRLNTLYPAVWNRGYTLHSSTIAQRAGGVSRNPLTSLPLLPFQDVLGGLVKQAYRQHLRVIPWFEYGLMMPVQSPIARKHPDWLTMTQRGEKVIQSGAQKSRLPKPLRDLKQAWVGADQGWLNPFHPDVQQFLTDLIADVVKRYAVDGIQLDDHFGLPIAFGYDPYTINLYRREHGGAAPPSNPADAEWMTWRADKLTQLMTKIAKAVKAARPAAIVSLSPNAPDFAYRTSLQDWTRWVTMGLLDEVVVQVYRDDLASLEADLSGDRLRSLQSSVPISIGLYTGPFLAAKAITQLQKEINAVRGADYNGVSFFCWETTLWWFKGSTTKSVSQTFVKLFPTTSKAPN